MNNDKTHRPQYRVVVDYWKESPGGHSMSTTVVFGPYFTMASVNRAKAEYRRIIDVYNEDEERRGSGIRYGYRPVVQVMYPEWNSLP